MQKLNVQREKSLSFAYSLISRLQVKLFLDVESFSYKENQLHGDLWMLLKGAVPKKMELFLYLDTCQNP